MAEAALAHHASHRWNLGHRARADGEERLDGSGHPSPARCGAARGSGEVGLDCRAHSADQLPLVANVSAASVLPLGEGRRGWGVLNCKPTLVRVAQNPDSVF